jgi:hypothetical protein
MTKQIAQIKAMIDQNCGMTGWITGFVIALAIAAILLYRN